MSQSKETQIYSPGNPDFADNSETAVCATSISPHFGDASQLSVKFSCETQNVIAFELFSYLSVKMNGFSTHDSTFLDQLIFTSASTNQIATQATVNSEVGLKQISSIYDKSRYG